MKKDIKTAKSKKNAVPKSSEAPESKTATPIKVEKTEVVKEVVEVVKKVVEVTEFISDVKSLICHVAGKSFKFNLGSLTIIDCSEELKKGLSEVQSVRIKK